MFISITILQHVTFNEVGHVLFSRLTSDGQLRLWELRARRD